MGNGLPTPNSRRRYGDDPGLCEAVAAQPLRTVAPRVHARPRWIVVLAGLAVSAVTIVLGGTAQANATPAPTITSFTTGNDYVSVGQWVNLSATLSTDITNSPYFVRLIDLTDGKILRECVSGSVCNNWVSSSTVSMHSYAVHLDRGRGGPAPYPIVAAPPAKSVNWVSTLPTLTSGRISFHTNDEDRDWNTRITVEAYKRDGSLAAHREIPLLHFDDNSDNGPFGIFAVSDTKWDDLRGGWLQITIHAVGHDTWRFNYSAQLYFDNGRYITISRNGIQMSNNRMFSWPINF
jgi:hypothetical protein